MSLLAGKVVCITGAPHGIGHACAVEAARQGAIGLILHYLGDEKTEDEVQTLKLEIEASYGARVVAVPGDIADAQTATRVRSYFRHSGLCLICLSLDC